MQKKPKTFENMFSIQEATEVPLWNPLTIQENVLKCQLGMLILLGQLFIG